VKRKNARTKPRRILCICLIAVGAILTFAIMPSKKRPVEPQVTPSIAPDQEAEMVIVITDAQGNVRLTIPQSEAVRLVNDLLADVNPSNPKNSYMTPFMAEKISWVYTETQAGRLGFNPYAGLFTTSDGRPKEATMMTSGYTSRNNDAQPPFMPFVNLSISRLFIILRVQQNVATGFNQQVKNTFALMLVHEAVHLEHTAEFYNQKRTTEEISQEEARAWFEVNIKAVRQLRASGQPLESDFIEIDNILLRCQDDPQCPQFLKYLNDSGKVPS